MIKTGYRFFEGSCGITLSGKSQKGSFTDKTKYIPLVESIKNMMSGASVAGSSSVNLVTSASFDFPDGKLPPKGYKAHDGLLRMDIADISQMQRDLEARVSEIESQIKNADGKTALLRIRESIKNKEKVSGTLIAALSDVNLSKMIESYNSTIQ